MLRYLLSRNLQPGARPGALSDNDVPAAVEHPLRIRHVTFDAATADEDTYDRFEDCPVDAPPGRVSWLHFQGDTPPTLLERLRDAFQLHPLAIEDVHNRGQRPKLESFGDHLFVTMVLPVRRASGLAFEQVSVFVGPHRVLSFHAGGEDIFAPVRRRIQAGNGRIRTGGSGYLLYALADVIVDHGFPLLESYADELEALEDEIFTEPKSNPVNTIHRIKRELIALRKVLWHQGAMLAELLRSEHPRLDESIRPYLRDAEDHARRINDLLDGYRDMCTSLLDTHLSLSSARLNDVMKMLTLIATIFMPLTFIAGIYGMNFEHMPELGASYGYPLALGAMLVTGIAMYLYFRFRRWL